LESSSGKPKPRSPKAERNPDDRADSSGARAVPARSASTNRSASDSSRPRAASEPLRAGTARAPEKTALDGDDFKR